MTFPSIEAKAVLLKRFRALETRDLADLIAGQFLKVSVADIARQVLEEREAV